MSKSALSERIAQAFYTICNNAYCNWVMYEALFDDDLKSHLQSNVDADYALDEIAKTLFESVYLKIARVHDTAVQNGRINLTCEYIIEYGGWSDEIYNRLSALNKEMRILVEGVKPARNRAIAHSDLQVMVNESTVGGFDEGADKKYFSDLQEFVNIVFKEVTGQIQPFYDGIAREARELNVVLKLGLEAARRKI